jgi:hypothetical protein
MSGKACTVYVVVDPRFGERLAQLPTGVQIWIVYTPINKPVAQRLWKEKPQTTHLTGITTYNYSENESPEQNFLKELDTIGLHHGICSTASPITRMEVIGTDATSIVKFKLADLGFHDITTTADGFMAVRPMRTTQT